MTAMRNPTRARGANRGGCGGGYEQTNPDYERDKLRRLRQTYDELAPQFRDTFLEGLSRWEQKVVTDRRVEIE